MSEKASILEAIFADKRQLVEAARSQLGPTGLSALERQARDMSGAREPFRFSASLVRKERPNIIAEFKRASPSKGPIDAEADPVARAADYEASGATAISVLTEEDHFSGSADDLRSIAEAVKVPVLRKDFIFDPFQIYEARILGADAILLIAAMLDDAKILGLSKLAVSLGMDPLLEVHDPDELARANSLGAKLIGVNNRDLKTFRVSLEVSRSLVRQKPRGALMVSESGISSREEIEELSELGFDGFLIGEAAMTKGLAGLVGSEINKPRTAEATEV